VKGEILHPDAGTVQRGNRWKTREPGKTVGELYLWLLRRGASQREVNAAKRLSMQLAKKVVRGEGKRSYGWKEFKTSVNRTP